MCTSVSHVHRSAPLWKQNPLSNHSWCAVVCTLWVLARSWSHFDLHTPSNHSSLYYIVVQWFGKEKKKTSIDFFSIFWPKSDIFGRQHLTAFPRPTQQTIWVSFPFHLLSYIFTKVSFWHEENLKVEILSHSELIYISQVFFSFLTFSPILSVSIATSSRLLWHDPAPHHTFHLSDVPLVTWLLGILWLLPLMFINEGIKLHEIR